MTIVRVASGPTGAGSDHAGRCRAIVARVSSCDRRAVRRALGRRDNGSCKPGDAAFARAHFELIARPKPHRCRRKIAKRCGHETMTSARSRGGSPRRCRRARPPRTQGARPGQAHRHLSGGELTVTVRATAVAARTRNTLSPRRLLKDTPNVAALRRHRRRRGGAGSASDPAGAVIEQRPCRNEIAWPRSRILFPTTDGHGVLCPTGRPVLTGPTLTNGERCAGVLVDLTAFPAPETPGINALVQRVRRNSPRWRLFKEAFTHLAVMAVS